MRLVGRGGQEGEGAVEAEESRREERKGEPENMSSQEDGTGGVWPQPAHAEAEKVACKCKCMRQGSIFTFQTMRSVDAGERLLNIDFERL